mmetsp:Transcript_28343/g.74400  ORF Transcript_28343/g.74400 Transcript_28343/m.74400 type:complete len:234 (+) Transcript_28343:1072-1773(+)
MAYSFSIGVRLIFGCKSCRKGRTRSCLSRGAMSAPGAMKLKPRKSSFVFAEVGMPGVSTGRCLVYSGSKFCTSNSPDSGGLKGGSTSFLYSLSQLIPSKKTCALISSAPFAPSRADGTRLKSLRRSDWAVAESCRGIASRALKIIVIVVLRLSEWKGRSPVSISYMRTPNDHQSAIQSWPFRLTTSGAMYSTVPQNEYVLPSAASSASFESPKSVRAMWPFESSRIFSGFRSR